MYYGEAPSIYEITKMLHEAKQKSNKYMTIKQQIEELIKDTEETVCFWSDLDDAIIGIDTQSYRVIYSYGLCLEILKRDMSQEDAIEHFEFNVRGAYIGEKTPIICDDFPMY